MSSKKKEKKTRGIASKYIKMVIFGILILVSVFVVFYLGVRMSSNFKTQEKTTKLGLEDVGELVTQTCYTTVLEDSKNNRDFFKLFDIPFTESRQIFSYDFEVDASVDFAAIKYSVDDEKQEIKVVLPHAKVYKTTLNPKSFKVYLDSESLFSRIDLEKHNKAVKKMEEQATKDCVSNNILDAADSNAQKLLEGFIKGNLTYKEYKIIYEYVKEK